MLRWLAYALVGLFVASQASAQAKRARRPQRQPAKAVAAPELRLEVPGQLVLGRDLEGEVRVRAPEGVRFRLHASTGELGEPAAVGGGLYRATYKPPAERFPQVALIAAISEDGSLFAQQRTELHGKAAVEVTSEPHVQVRVRVGGAVYGPVVADARGRATIDILVPPGHPEATSIATDALGNEKEQPLPLGVPGLSRLFAVCPEFGQSVIVLALDARGRPDPAAEFELAASRATVASTKALAPGTYRVELGVPEDVRAGEIAQVSVASRSDARVRSSCQLKIPLELPNAVALELSASSISASAPEVVTVRVALRYPGKRDPASVPVRLVADLGEVAAANGRTSSVYETTWRVPPAFGGLTRAQLTVRAGSLAAQASVTLVPGPIAALRAELADDALLADGRSNTQITVWASDAHDNPANGAQLTAAAEGRVGAFRAVGLGQYEGEYRVPAETRGQLDRIALRDLRSGAATQVVVSLRGVRAPIRLGLRAGYATNFARVTGPVAGLLAEYRLPFALQAFTVGVDAAYHRGSDAQASADGREVLDVTVDALPLLGTVAYGVNAGDFDVALAAGAGVLLAGIELASSNTGSVRASTTSFAWSAALRGTLALGPGGVLLEIGYLHSEVDTDAVRGNLGGAHATAGYAFELGL